MNGELLLLAYYNRLCYYTVESLLFKQRFLMELWNTFGGGEFICAFSERELSKFHNFLEKEFPFTQKEKVKKGIMCVGKQPKQCDQNKVIGLNPDVQISEDGSFISITESDYVWQPIGGP